MLLLVGSLDAKTDALVPGSQVAGHVLEQELGRGGMGVVWLARHVETGAERAIKVLQVAGDPERALRFLREAEAMARADGHPNVVRVFGAGREGTRLHLVMERVDGGDLGGLLAREGPPPVELAVEWTLGVCAAVVHLHGRGVLHRDLKPQNVLLDLEAGGKDGVPRPKLADFGLARLAGVDRLTKTGAVLGSPSYMAPEQAAGAEPDERTDVYGLGGVLYALLCGRPPFGGEGGGAAQTVSRLLTRPPDPPSNHRPVPAALEAVCLRCLEKEPGARYARAADVARDLERWRRGELAPPRRTGPVVAAALLGAGALGASWAVASLRRDVVDAPSPEVAVVASRAAAPRATPAERARDDYLRAVSGALGADAVALRAQLARLAGALGPAELAALEPRKARALAELAEVASATLVARMADRRKAGPLLDALAAVSQSPPSVALPPALAELLDETLRERIRTLRADDQGEVGELVDFELRRARALDHRRRPPPELREALTLAFVGRGRDFPLAWLRACMWADFDGLVAPGVLSPREALRSLSEDELARAALETPGSQALALIRLERLVHRTDKGSAVPGLKPWQDATADGERAGSGPPSDLGPRWTLFARRLTVKLLFRRTAEGKVESPAESAAVRARTVELGRRVIATARARIEAGEPLRQDLSDLREATQCVADSLLLDGQDALAIAAHDEAMALARPFLVERVTDSDLAGQAQEILQGAVNILTRARDARAGVVARDALDLARGPRERRDAIVALVGAHLDVEPLRPALGEVDAAHLRGDDRFRELLVPTGPSDGGGTGLAMVAVRSAVALGDLPLARARAELAVARYPDLRETLEASVAKASR